MNMSGTVERTVRSLSHPGGSSYPLKASHDFTRHLSPRKPSPARKYTLPDVEISPTSGSAYPEANLQ